VTNAVKTIFEKKLFAKDNMVLQRENINAGNEARNQKLSANGR
jgi:hypothetical protein